MRVKHSILFIIIPAFVPLACQLLNNDDDDVKDVFNTMETETRYAPKDFTTLKDSGATVNGMKQGIWFEYTVDSTLLGTQKKSVIDTEKKEGMHVQILVKDEIGKYKDNKREGLWRTYLALNNNPGFDAWRLYSECRYRAGLKDSFEVIYSLGGSDTQALCKYKAGKMYGEVISYFRNYQPQGIYTVRDGQTWLKKDYYRDGRIKHICSDTMLNNTKHVFYKLYSDSTVLRELSHGPILEETGFLVNDTLWDGPLTDYYPNGKIKSVTTYIAGKADGEAKDYFDNGQLNITWVYSKGLLLNIKDHFNKDGNKLDPGTLKDGNGTVKLYNDDDGSLKETLHYKNGLQVD